MNSVPNNDSNFFDKFGLEVRSGDVEVGKTYPIYGMITNFISEEPGNTVVELNFNIVAKMSIPSQDKLDVLMNRSFEPGIFVGTVVDTEDKLTIDCSTVIFGRKQQNQA